MPPEPLDELIPDDARLDELNPDELRRADSLLDELIADDDDARDTGTTMGGKPPGPFDLRAWRRSVTKGPLREEIDAACADTGMTLKQLTVLADKSDPYRFDTPAGHRDGQWFKDQLLSTTAIIHLRGLHYIISAHGNVQRPNGALYVNDLKCWEWLVEEASNAARWLGYVPFSRIRDERNAPPDDYLVEDYTDTAQGWVSCGQPQTAPDFADIVPRPLTTQLQPRQPYLIILLGEKSSLHAELSPVAKKVGGLLFLPTGEISATLVEDMARRIVADGRPAVVIYFTDLDPSGWQMAVSVARKLQSLRTLLYAGLDVRLIRGGLTRQQAEDFKLPSTPLKETETRSIKWEDATGREQTELDAMIALHPGTLQQIARDTVAPFYDDTLQQRCQDALDDWLDAAQQRLEASPGFQPACALIRQARDELAAAIEVYNSKLDAARALLSDIDDEIEAPEAEIDDEDQPEPLFTTDDDFVEATLKLIASKNYEDV